MKPLAIITARGGSKRIPRKNIKNFAGKPVISYPIRAAIDSGLFDEVIVSTDDEEIAELSKKYGAVIPFMRSPENSNDLASTAAVLLEVMKWYNAKGKSYERACCIYPTAAFVSPSQLISTYDNFVSGKFDSLFPVARFSYPIQRAIKMDEQGKLAWVQPENEKVRSQDLPFAYHDCGQFYWFNVVALLKNKALFTANTGAVVLNEMEYHDIDNEEDWRIAEFKFNYNRA